MPDRPTIVLLPSADRRPSDRRSSRQRSAVTNGSSLFLDGDNKSPWARRFADLCAGHIADLGGPSDLSEAQTSLVRRCAALEVELERMEGQMSKGEPIDLDLFGRSTNTLARQLARLGLKREPGAREIDPIDDHWSRPPAR